MPHAAATLRQLVCCQQAVSKQADKTWAVQAYIWLDSVKASLLPKQLAQPFLAVARLLDMPPVMTYAADVLLNFKLCVAPG